MVFHLYISNTHAKLVLHNKNMSTETARTDPETASPELALDPAGAKGLGSQSYEALLDLILSRELKQGDLIQERALALRLGISRTPLREAMHRLEGERILERQGNNRLFVRHITVQEIMEALYVRRLLESDAAARAAGNIPVEALRQLRARVNDLLASDDPSNPEHQQLDADLHSLIAESCDNQLMAEMIGELRRKTRMFSLKRLNKRLAPVCNEHLAMIGALERGDAQAAAEETVRHIDNIRKAIVDKLASL